MRSPAAPLELPNQGLLQSTVQFICHLLLIFLCVNQSVPGVNESHYLPKARHYWDSSFAPGDLFLESHDSHFLTSSLAGLVSQCMPLLAVAWIGRLVSWALLAIAWAKLCHNLRISGMFRPLALAGWLLGVHYGNWAGEWVAGGFEAKAIAYPLVVLGLASLVLGNWKWVWIWMGCAIAWHPVVGGWAGLSAGLVWLLQPNLKCRFKAQIPWLLCGACLALVGVIPAAQGLGGPDVVDSVSAAQVQVYLRLPHHMSPQRFAVERDYAAFFSLAGLLIATLAYRQMAIRASSAETGGKTGTVSGLGRLLGCAWIAVIFSCTGLIIDWALSASRPDIAAKLLRFYWFRWSDVAVPLASSLVLWSYLCDKNNFPAVTQMQLLARPAKKRELLVGFAVLLTLAAVATRVRWGGAQEIPPADRLVVESSGPNQIVSNRYVDWLAVCQWIRENTPTDSLWLTPKYQQSFKWHAERAEVYCWKDIPQDNAAVIAWYDRVQRCAPPRDANGQIRDWTTAELLDLSEEYDFEWVLIDRSYQSFPPALELRYPVVENGQYIDNRSFAVFHIPSGLVRKPN